MSRTAAVITVGSELVAGLRLDTNTAEIARELAPRGFKVVEAVSVADDERVLAGVIRRLSREFDLVVVTGGLGPTHDDITREAASEALSLPLHTDPRLVAKLQPWLARHHDPDAEAGILREAMVLEGAQVIDPTTGTAAGLVIKTAESTLALLPGPPSEMRPMLQRVASEFELAYAQPIELGVAGMTESDAQLAASRALAALGGVGFTILSRPGDVRVLLLDEGAGAQGLQQAADAVCAALGDNCYSADGASLETAVVAMAIREALTLACAESCTGGMVASALTTVPGSSAAFLGGIVSYHNDAKRELLGVSAGSLERFGAVSEQVAREMAEGARTRLNADLAVAVTGVAGPDGGTADKPVGLVWFAIASAHGTTAFERRYPASGRDAIRMRATATALDLLRREMLHR